MSPKGASQEIKGGRMQWSCRNTKEERKPNISEYKGELILFMFLFFKQMLIYDSHPQREEVAKAFLGNVWQC